MAASPEPEPLDPEDVGVRLEAGYTLLESPATPWALHPLVDGRVRWGDVSPQRAREMIRASEIARHLGDRGRLGLPEKPAIPAQQWLQEEAMFNEIKARRGRAIEEVKRIHGRLQQLKSPPTPIVGVVQQMEISSLVTALANNLQTAFSPNPNLMPEAIDPMMAQIFAELVDAYAVQVEEGIELATRLRMIHTHLSRTGASLRILPALEFGQSINVPPVPLKSAKTDVVMTDAQKYNFRSPNCEEPSSESDSSDTQMRNGKVTLYSPTDPQANLVEYTGSPGDVTAAPAAPSILERRRSTGKPAIQSLGLFVVTGTSTAREMRLQQEIRNTKRETVSLRLDLDATKRDQQKLQELVDRVRTDRAGSENDNAFQETQELHTRSQTHVEIIELRKKIAELRQQREIAEDETPTIEQSGCNRLSREATLRVTLKSFGSDNNQDSKHRVELTHQTVDDTSQPERLGQIAGMQHQINKLAETILKLQRERDSAVHKAEAAEKKLQELKEKPALHPGVEEQDTAQIRHLRAQDRQISDLITVRDNLRAEVVRRNGRVVGADGEVTRERYNPARWEEAGRREQEGRPRIYRDAWGPEGDDNAPREEWPPEYQPGSPGGEVANGFSSERMLADTIQRLLELLNSERGVTNAYEHPGQVEVALANLRLEIIAAYQGVRTVFPEIEEEGECLAGLVRILREKRQQIATEVNELRGKNEALASSVQELEDRLQQETRIRGGGLRYCLDEVQGPRPSPRCSSSPSNCPIRISDVEDNECGQSGPSVQIPESLCYDSSGSRYTPFGSPTSASPQRSPWSHEDRDGGDPDNQGITRQGASQEQEEQQLAGQEEPKLRRAQMANDIQQESGSHGSQRIVASGDVRKALSASRSPDRGQQEPKLNRPGPPRPASETAGESHNAEVNEEVGPTSMDSPYANCPGRLRRDPTPTTDQEARVEAEPGEPPHLGHNTRYASLGGPTRRAGTRATRNPAPVYCPSPQRRKRKAAGPGDGEPPRKRR